VADHIVVVRHHGGECFLGAMTGKTARDLTVKLDFLGSGDWKMRLWKDAADSATNAENLETEDRTVSASDTLTVHMVPNGGAVAHFWL